MATNNRTAKRPRVEQDSHFRCEKGHKLSRYYIGDSSVHMKLCPKCDRDDVAQLHAGEDRIEAHLAEPRCFTRRCKHFQGVCEPRGGGEESQFLICSAFPPSTGGIPNAIAYGDDLHLVKHPRQVGDVVYEQDARSYTVSVTVTVSGNTDEHLSDESAIAGEVRSWLEDLGTEVTDLTVTRCPAIRGPNHAR
jgi:hypothetical protein